MIRLRPLIEEDLAMLRRFATEPGLIGPNWSGFRDAQAPSRRFAVDGYLGPDDSWLIVELEADQAVAGIVTYRSGQYGAAGKHWEIGISLLPEYRGRGIGWRAQAIMCDYLFTHTPAQRIQAGTQVENLAEQRALEKAGFLREGVIRAAEFRTGQWRDGIMYSRLRTDPPPTEG